MADGYRIAVQIDRLTKSIVPLLNAIQIACMEQLSDCIDVGCKLLEGSFLSKPKVVKERKFNANEAGDWDQLPADFDSNVFETAYRQSLQWTKESMLAMHEN